jgi:hypothetical protein
VTGKFRDKKITGPAIGRFNALWSAITYRTAIFLSLIFLSVSGPVCIRNGGLISRRQSLLESWEGAGYNWMAATIASCREFAPMPSPFPGMDPLAQVFETAHGAVI